MEYVEGIRQREDLERMLDYLGRWNMMYRMAFFVGCNTGLRTSDLRRLTAGHVRHAKHFILRVKKTGKLVRIPISRHLARELEPYIAGMADSDYLFKSRQGFNRPITRARLYQVLTKAASVCGLKHIGCHSMRKSFGWALYQQTKDMRLVGELLGHRDPGVTARYIGVVDSDVDAALKDFSVLNRSR